MSKVTKKIVSLEFVTVDDRIAYRKVYDDGSKSDPIVTALFLGSSTKSFSKLKWSLERNLVGTFEGADLLPGVDVDAEAPLNFEERESKSAWYLLKELEDLLKKYAILAASTPVEEQESAQDLKKLREDIANLVYSCVYKHNLGKRVHELLEKYRRN